MMKGWSCDVLIGEWRDLKFPDGEKLNFPHFQVPQFRSANIEEFLKHCCTVYDSVTEIANLRGCISARTRVKNLTQHL